MVTCSSGGSSSW